MDDLNTTNKLLRDLIEKLGGKDSTVEFERGDYTTFIKSIQESTKEIKSAKSGYRMFTDALSGQKQSIEDGRNTLERYDNQIEKLIAQGKELEALDKQAEKAEYAKTTAVQNAKAAAINFGAGMLSVTDSVINGVLDFVSSLQSSASGVEIASKLLVNEVKIAAQSTQVVADGMGDVGMAMMALPGPLKIVGFGLELLGKILGIVTKKSAEYAEKGIGILTEELKKTQEGFKTVTAAGISFGHGMTELRARAAQAGLDVTQFANALKSSNESLQMMGLGMMEGAKRIGRVSHELRNSQLGMQLRKLGYSVEEQAELSAQVMANERAAGNKRVMSDQEIAKQTADYGRTLKILQGITGEDAKKAMEKARMQALEADLLAKAMKMGGPEAVKRLQAQLATMPEGMKKGYMEFVSTGGRAITDAATQVAMQQNPQIRAQYEQQMQDLKNAGMTQEQAMEAASKYTEQTGKYAREHMDNTEILGMSARLTGDGFLQGVAAINNGLILTGTKIGEGITEKVKEEVKIAEINTEPLDNAVHSLEEDTQKLKAALTDKLTPMITTFADTLHKNIQTVDEVLKIAQAGLDKARGLQDEVTTNADMIGKVALAATGLIAVIALAKKFLSGKSAGGLVGEQAAKDAVENLGDRMAGKKPAGGGKLGKLGKLAKGLGGAGAVLGAGAAGYELGTAAKEWSDKSGLTAKVLDYFASDKEKKLNEELTKTYTKADFEKNKSDKDQQSTKDLTDQLKKSNDLSKVNLEQPKESKINVADDLKKMSPIKVDVQNLSQILPDKAKNTDLTAGLGTAASSALMSDKLNFTDSIQKINKNLAVQQPEVKTTAEYKVNGESVAKDDYLAANAKLNDQFKSQYAAIKGDMGQMGTLHNTNMTQILADHNQKAQAMMKGLNDTTAYKIDSVTAAVSNNEQFGKLSDLMSKLVDNSERQVAKQDEMLSIIKDQKDISTRLYHASV